MRISRGFTLIEVLIAATILFAALVVVSETYRSSLLSSRRAESIARMLTPLPLITERIRNDLREQHPERSRGSGEVLGVKFSYGAETAQFAAPPRRFDPEAAAFVSYAPRYRLYDVRLDLEFDGQHRVFLYQDVAWQSLQGE